VSLLLANYDEDWTRLWWLRVDGAAELRGAGEAAAIAALRGKYPQYERVPVLGPDALLVRIAVRTRTSWCASDLSQR
jgi:hypothetical protein